MCVKLPTLAIFVASGEPAKANVRSLALSVRTRTVWERALWVDSGRSTRHQVRGPFCSDPGFVCPPIDTQRAHCSSVRGGSAPPGVRPPRETMVALEVLTFSTFQSIGNSPTEDEVTTTGDRQRCAPPRRTVPILHSAFVAVAYRVSIQLRGVRSQRNLNMQIRRVRGCAPLRRNWRAER